MHLLEADDVDAVVEDVVVVVVVVVDDLPLFVVFASSSPSSFADFIVADDVAVDIALPSFDEVSFPAPSDLALPSFMQGVAFVLN